MRPLYLRCDGGHTVAAIFQPANGASTGTAVLLVPPFGWDEQTSYRPRRDWSLSLAQSGFPSLRIELPGTGDSSGSARDDELVDAWAAAISSGVDWLRHSGATRVAVIALGAGGLVTCLAMARGARVDDLVIWGMPASGRAFLREIKAFGRIEQAETGEPAGDTPEGELRAGGHVLAPATVEALSALDPNELLRAGGPVRALVLGRDGRLPDDAVLESLRNPGAEVRTEPGHGWGAAIARPQSTSPKAIFEMVNAWLAERAETGVELNLPASADSAELGVAGARIRETPVVFEGAGQQLYAVLAEPVDAPVAGSTMILFNAGAIRRIGPNRMWTEAARRWASAGVPTLRVDVEGIGDAGGDSCAYRDTDDTFYTAALVAQSNAALALAVERGLPPRFLLAGLCSGAFWAFQLALDDPRVSDVIALNPRMLLFQDNVEGSRDLRKLRRLLKPRGLRNLMREKHKARRFSRMAASALKAPSRVLHGAERTARNELSAALRTLETRGQRLHIAFSGDEPLHRELCKSAGEPVGRPFRNLPCTSHTLKPLRAQQAAHALIDEIVARAMRPD